MASSILRRVSGVVQKFSSMSIHSRTSPSPSPSPWLVLARGAGDTVDKMYSLTDEKVLSLKTTIAIGGEESEMVGSSHGWLAVFEPRNSHLFLVNPLTRRSIELPAIGELPDAGLKYRGGRSRVNKVIMSCSPEDEDEECIAVMSFGYGDTLAYCYPGRANAEWTSFGAPNKGFTPIYHDFAYSRERKVLTCMANHPALHQAFVIAEWDLGRRPPAVKWSAKSRELRRKRTSNVKFQPNAEWHRIRYISRFNYVLNFNSQVYIIDRCVMARTYPDRSYADWIWCGRYKNMQDCFPYQTVGFVVHKLDGVTNVMDRMEDGLDGLAVFVGLNHTFALPAADCRRLNLKPDSIYFTDEKYFDCTRKRKSYGGHDVGILDYRTGSIEPCYYPCDYKGIKALRPPPLWYLNNN